MEFPDPPWWWRIEAGYHRVRWETVRRLRRALRRDGEFAAGENSARARALSEAWSRQWQQTSIGQRELGRAAPERHVRFHNLPMSKQYPDTADEMAEVLRRQLQLIHTVLHGAPIESLTLISPDWGSHSWGSGRFRKARPDAWPWRIDAPLPGEEDYEVPAYLWVDGFRSLEDLEGLLSRVAVEDSSRGEVAPHLATEDCEWVLVPYPGGVDVFGPDPEAIAQLQAEHEDWLPAPHE